MPNYFQLISKETGEPTRFQQIDEELCAFFDQPVDPEHWLAGWYDSIGWRVSSGKSLEEVKTEYEASAKEQLETGTVDGPKRAAHYNALIVIVEYLMEYYTTNAWFSRNKE